MADRAELQRLLDNAATKPHEFIAANVIDHLPSLLAELAEKDAEIERYRALTAALVEEITAVDVSNITAIPSSVIYALFCDYGIGFGAKS